MAQADTIQNTAGLFEYTDSHGGVSITAIKTPQSSTGDGNNSKNFWLGAFGTSAFRRHPNVTTSHTAETEMRGPTPPKCCDDNAIVSVAKCAGFADPSLSFFIKLGTVRHGAPCGSIATLIPHKKLNGASQYSRLRKP
jgi:hypothetical protein